MFGHGHLFLYMQNMTMQVLGINSSVEWTCWLPMQEYEISFSHETF